MADAKRPAGGKKSFLAKLRGQEAQKKQVNPALEKMIAALLADAISPNTTLTFGQKMDIGKLALQLEAVRNKLKDMDFGTGFLDDLDSEPASSEPEPQPPDGER